MSTMALTTAGFLRMCCPRDLRNSMPVKLGRRGGARGGESEEEKG